MQEQARDDIGGCAKAKEEEGRRRGEDGSEERVGQKSRGIQKQDMIRELEEIRSHSFLFPILCVKSAVFKTKCRTKFTVSFTAKLLIGKGGVE